MINLALLHPAVRVMAIILMHRCRNIGINIILVQGFRSFAEQDALYAKGRTEVGKIVTNAKGGYSFHNYGLAFDFCPLRADGSTDWDDMKKFERVGARAEDIGMTWGGRWKMKDMGHCQFTFGFAIEEMFSEFNWSLLR